MIRFFSKRFALLSSVGVSLVFPGGVFGNFITFSEGGDATTASIQDTVDKFRAALGDPNNGNTPGPLEDGRREINWDGGGDATTVSGTPFDGFLNIRGARFTTPAPYRLHSGAADRGTTGRIYTAFSNPTLAHLRVFSPQRIFSPIGSNITDVSFFVPGTDGLVPATVSGFGAIFTDVDLAYSTSIQFFDTSDKLIFDQAVLPGTVSDKSFSFLGAIGNAGEQISVCGLPAATTLRTIQRGSTLSRWTILFMGSLRVCLSRAVSS